MLLSNSVKSKLHFQVLTLHLIMGCDAVTAEAAETYRICRDLTDSKNQYIIKYMKYVKHHRVCFTAANFFEINRGTILSIVGIVTNYLIVILQFNGIYIHKSFEEI